MKPPTATPDDTQTKEGSHQADSQSVNKDPVPKGKNPTKEQVSNPEAQTPEEIPKENENVDTPSAKQSHAQKCLNLIFNTKNKDDVDTEQVKTAGESYANFFDIETDLKLEDDGK